MLSFQNNSRDLRRVRNSEMTFRESPFDRGISRERHHATAPPVPGLVALTVRHRTGGPSTKALDLESPCQMTILSSYDKK